MPSFTSVNPNTRVLGGDDDVADRGQAGAAAERGAVNPADERDRQPSSAANIRAIARASRRFSSCV